MKPDEREKLVKEKKIRKRRLEACLILTRSFYKLHEDTFEKYLNDHPST